MDEIKRGIQKHPSHRENRILCRLTCKVSQHGMGTGVVQSPSLEVSWDHGDVALKDEANGHGGVNWGF